MRKFSTDFYDAPIPQPRRSARTRAALAILVGLILAPVVYEATAVCASRWIAMYSQVSTPHTPVLNLLSHVGNQFTSALGVTFRRIFFNLPWKASVVIPLTFVWAVIGCLFMIRKR